MAVFRIEKTRDYTVMSNHHLRNTELSLKAKELLSLPENWDYTTKGLARICKDGVDSICAGVRELEEQGYVVRERVRNPNGQLGAIEYTILKQHRPPEREKPEQEKPAQLNKDISSKQRSKTDLSSTEISNPIQSNPQPLTGTGMGAREIYREIILENIGYADYEPYKAVHDMSRSLSGLKKLKYDKEHEHELVMYENTRTDLKTLLAEGKKITPKAWRTEKEQLEKEVPILRSERARACHDLAFAEVISHNKANLERVEQNVSRQQDRQQGRTKRSEEEI